MSENRFSVGDLVRFKFVAGASKPVETIGEIVRMNKKHASIRCGGFVYSIPFDKIIQKVSTQK